MLTARFTRRRSCISDRPSGRSSVVEHDLAKVGVEGSNPFARSSFTQQIHQLSSAKGYSGLPAFLVGVTLG